MVASFPVPSRIRNLFINVYWLLVLIYSFVIYFCLACHNFICFPHVDSFFISNYRKVFSSLFWVYTSLGVTTCMSVYPISCHSFHFGDLLSHPNPSYVGLIVFPFGFCRSVVGELDEELDSSLDLSQLRAHPLKPVIH